MSPASYLTAPPRDAGPNCSATKTPLPRGRSGRLPPSNSYDLGPRRRSARQAVSPLEAAEIPGADVASVAMTAAVVLPGRLGRPAKLAEEARAARVKAAARRRPGRARQRAVERDTWPLLVGG